MFTYIVTGTVNVNIDSRIFKRWLGRFSSYCKDTTVRYVYLKENEISFHYIDEAHAQEFHTYELDDYITDRTVTSTTQYQDEPDVKINFWMPPPIVGTRRRCTFQRKLDGTYVDFSFIYLDPRSPPFIPTFTNRLEPRHLIRFQGSDRIEARNLEQRLDERLEVPKDGFTTARWNECVDKMANLFYDHTDDFPEQDYIDFMNILKSIRRD